MNEHTPMNGPFLVIYVAKHFVGRIIYEIINTYIQRTNLSNVLIAEKDSVSLEHWLFIESQLYTLSSTLYTGQYKLNKCSRNK